MCTTLLIVTNKTFFFAMTIDFALAVLSGDVKQFQCLWTVFSTYCCICN